MKKAYEPKQFEGEIYIKLKEAELEAKSTDIRHSHEEVFANLRSRVSAKLEDNV